VDSSYGNGWKCERGYTANGKGCSAVKVPKNAHLNFSGNGWECNRPYGKQGSGCTLR
jgi:hypothetical protein